MSESLDNYCSKIFWFLFLNDKKCRFNELHKRIKGINFKVSKPTLIVHLGHLQDKGFIIRTQEDKQNVSYRVNLDKFKFLKESVGYKQLLLNTNKNKEIFHTLSPRDQLATLIDIMTLYSFHGVRNDISSFLEPEKKAENHLAFWFFFKSLDMYRVWFLETFKQSDEKTRKLLIEKIDGGIELLRNDLFTSEKADITE